MKQQKNIYSDRHKKDGLLKQTVFTNNKLHFVSL